jgi:Family of unknown function (DUF5362)
METNPYSAPAANPSFGSNIGGGPVSAAAVAALAATKPWVRFMSVMVFIAAGFMVLAAIVMGVAAMSGTMMKSSGGAANPFAGPLGLVLIAVYAVLAIVYIFPGVKLWKYASSIAVLMQTGRDEDLVAALNQQRSFWKLIGVMLLVMLVLYVVAIVAGGVFAGISAAKMR